MNWVVRVLEVEYSKGVVSLVFSLFFLFFGFCFVCVWGLGVFFFCCCILVFSVCVFVFMCFFLGFWGFLDLIFSRKGLCKSVLGWDDLFYVFCFCFFYVVILFRVLVFVNF